MRIHSAWIWQHLTSRRGSLIQGTSGQGMVEYVLIIALIAVAVIGFLPPVANAIVQLVSRIVAAFES